MRYSDEMPIIYIGKERYLVKQITRRSCKKIYDAEKPFFIHPCNASLYSEWTRPMLIENYDPMDKSFTAFVNEFEYYNCNSQMGKYAIFFEIINVK